MPLPRGLSDGAPLPGPSLGLRVLEGRFAVCRLPAEAPIPSWVFAAEGFCSITRTREELSIVCAEAAVPPGVEREPGFCALAVEGPLDFALTGVLAALAGPLAAAGVSLFAVSTFDTDYLLVKESARQSALRALSAAGHRIAPS